MRPRIGLVAVPVLSRSRHCRRQPKLGYGDAKEFAPRKLTLRCCAGTILLRQSADPGRTKETANPIGPTHTPMIPSTQQAPTIHIAIDNEAGSLSISAPFL